MDLETYSYIRSQRAVALRIQEKLEGDLSKVKDDKL